MSDVLVVQADDLFAPARVLPPVLAVRDGRVIASGAEAARLGPPRRVAGTMIPALIDLQLNGGAGVDLQQPGPDRARLHRWLAAGGVLTYTPTLVSAPVARLASLAGGLAGELEGVLALKPHFEGPFISTERLGAHERDAVTAAVAAELAEVMIQLGSYVTLAPERDGAAELARRLLAAGVAVSAGHSDATMAQAEAALAAGITQVTHLFNAMRPLHHREPGLAGAALVGRSAPAVGVIADGVHLEAAMVLLAARLLPDRMYLVSDAVASAGQAPESRLPTGVLAGSVCRLDEGLRNAIRWGIDAAAAVAAVTATPARAAGLTDRGRLEPGALALVALADSDWTVRAAGRVDQLVAAGATAA